MPQFPSKIGNWSAPFLVLWFLCLFACNQDDKKLANCDDPLFCNRGYLCENDTCMCPDDRIEFYNYCVRLQYPLMYMSRGGCECADSMIWALSDKIHVVGNDGYYTQQMYTPVINGPEVLYEMNFYQNRFAIRGYPDNRDSFFMPHYNIADCPIGADINTTPIVIAYASGIFTSDSTGFMHLDWHRLGDSLPYRRCTMPFTRIK